MGRSHLFFPANRDGSATYVLPRNGAAMENPNEYDEDKFLEAANAPDEAVAEMWEAGASPDDIKNAVDNAIRNQAS